MSINISTTRAIIIGALARGHHNGMRPLCVAALDSGGHLVAFERDDGVANRRFGAAHANAHGAVSFGFSSRALGTIAVERPHFAEAAALAGIFDAGLAAGGE